MAKHLLSDKAPSELIMAQFIDIYVGTVGASYQKKIIQTSIDYRAWISNNTP